MRKRKVRMKEKAKKLIKSMKIKMNYLGNDLEKLEKTLEEDEKNV